MDIDPFLIRAGLAALGTALAASLLGCFVVWRRMAYFGDATAHAAILGVALSLVLSVSIVAGVLAAAAAMALALHWLEGQGREINLSLGVLSHGALAAGLVGVALAPGGARLDLEGFLFGDVLFVTWAEVGLIWAGAATVAGLLWWNWSALLAATLSPDLSIAAGIRPGRQRLLLALLMAVVVAVAIRVVGALLITALLIVPAATARGLARSPEGMAALSALAGTAAALGGLGAAVAADTPVGPTIVCTAVALFAVSLLRGALR